MDHQETEAKTLHPQDRFNVNRVSMIYMHVANRFCIFAKIISRGREANIAEFWLQSGKIHRGIALSWGARTFLFPSSLVTINPYLGDGAKRPRQVFGS